MKKLIIMSVLVLAGLVGSSQASVDKLNFSSLSAGCGTTGANTQIKGIVRNQNTLAKIGGASLVLSSSDTFSLCQTTTSVSSGVWLGTYAFPSLVYAPNSYYLTVSKSGFQTWQRLLDIPTPVCCLNPYEYSVNVLLTPQ